MKSAKSKEKDISSTQEDRIDSEEPDSFNKQGEEQQEEETGEILTETRNQVF